jgi:hypothetical protein
VARISISTLLFIFGAIQLVWSFFSDKPIIPSIPNWLQTKGYSVVNSNFILALFFFLLGLLVLKFSKSKSTPLEMEFIAPDGNDLQLYDTG